MTKKIIEKTVDHLEDIAVSLGAEFLDKKLDHEYKSHDNKSIVFFKVKKDLCETIKLRILTGKRKKYGDIVDELVIKKVGSKGKIRRHIVKPDYVKENLEKFHKRSWSHYKEVKSFSIKEYIKKLYHGFKFEDKKREHAKSLNKFLKNMAVLIESIASTLGLEEGDEDFTEEAKQYEKEQAQEIEETGEEKVEEIDISGEEKTEEIKITEDDKQDSPTLQTRKPSRLRSIVKKIAFTVATVALSAIATPLAGALIQGGTRAFQGASAASKLAQASLSSVRSAANPFNVVKTIVKKTAKEAGKQVIDQ